jgi:hypothetical protein
MKRREEEEKNPYKGVENQLLNTFFSGVYLTNFDFYRIGKKMGIPDIAMKSRDFLVHELFAVAQKEDRIEELIRELSIVIDKRLAIYKEYMEQYPNSRKELGQLIYKAMNLKRTLMLSMRKGIYE